MTGHRLTRARLALWLGWFLLLAVAAAGAAAVWLESRDPTAHHLPRLKAQLSLDPGSVDPAASRPVRVVFYGQSITRQNWWQGVAEHLQQRYPHRRFEFANLAVGGHDASRLVRMVAADVLPLQPDLVIFHVYGAPRDLRRTLEQIRGGTLAEVLLANDHLVDDAELAEEVADLRLFESGLIRRWAERIGFVGPGSTWQAWRNHDDLPELAAELGVALADVRQGWKRELRAMGSPAAALLADHIHLNAKGEALMQRLMIEAIDEHLAAGAQGAEAASRVSDRRITAGPSCAQPLELDGYRLDVRGPAGVRLKVEVDGHLASRWPVLLEPARSSLLPGTDFPGLLQFQRLSDAASSVRPGRYRVDIGARDEQGHYAVSWQREGDAAVVQGSTAQDLRWESNGLQLAASDWNLSFAEEAYQRRDFSGSAVMFELRAPVERLELRDDQPVTVLRFPVNGPHAVCLSTDGPSVPLTIIQYRAPLDCSAGPRGRCNTNRN